MRRVLVAPVAAKIARLHPALRIELDLDDRPRDLVCEGFDVALRLGLPRDSEHVSPRSALPIADCCGDGYCDPGGGCGVSG